MAERGSIGGLDFRFQQFPQAVPPAQQVGSFGLPPAQVSVPEVDDDPLAVREKLTNDYYSNMGLIRSFAEDMSKKGIDPFEPDYSQEGGGLAFQTMQKLQAGLMFAANALKNEFQREKQVNDAVLRGDARIKSDFDPRSQMFTQTPDAAFSTQLDPRITAANQRTAQNTFTQRDSQNLNAAVYDPTRQAILNDPNLSEEERAYQLGGLFSNVPETSYQQLIPRGGSGSRGNHEVEVLKKVTNITQGVWPEGTYDLTTRGGKALLVNKTYAGEVMGEYEGVDAKGNPKIYKKILKRWLKDPETGEVIAEYTDPNIPKEVVSNTTGDVYAAALITNNPKYGDAAKMYSAARELGLLDDTSSARNEALISQNADTLRQSAAERAKGESGVTEKYNVVKNELTKLSNPFIGHNWKVYALPDGRQLEIGKHKGSSGKFFIQNWEELFGGSDSSQFENLTLDQALGFLDQFNYFDKFLGQKAQPSAEALKAQELIEKYRKK